MKSSLNVSAFALLTGIASLCVIGGFSRLYGQADAGLVAAVTDSTFESEVEKSSKPVLVDFWATWCGPCRMYAPTVDQLAVDYKGRLKVVRVDIDQNPQLARSFEIRAIPTSVLFKKGKVVKEWVGVVSEEDLKVEVNKVIKHAKKAQAPKS